MNFFRRRASAARTSADGSPADADQPAAVAGAQPQAGAPEQMHASWTGLQRGPGQDEDEFEGEGWTFWGL